MSALLLLMAKCPPPSMWVSLPFGHHEPCNSCDLHAGQAVFPRARAQHLSSGLQNTESRSCLWAVGVKAVSLRRNDISAEGHECRQQAHCWGQAIVLGSFVQQTCITNPRYTKATSSSAGTALVDSDKGQGLVQWLLSHIDRCHVCRVSKWPV